MKHTFQSKTKYTGNTIIKCYGVTQDPQTKNYAFVLEYIPNGDLHHFIHKNFENFTLNCIIRGINEIHDKKLYIEIYSGNILNNNYRY